MKHSASCHVRQPLRCYLVFLPLLFLLVGCASTYNPLQADKYTFDAKFQECYQPGADGQYPYSKGVGCAHKVRSAYLDAAASEAAWSDRLAVLLIPAAASIIGIGIAEVGTKTITGVALGTAAGYGIGTWLISKPRQEVYGLGAQAVSCVITASSPLNVPKEINDQIKEARKTLEEKLRELDRKIVELRGRLPESVLQKAVEVKAKAEEILRSADGTLTAISQGGQTVWNAVMEVDAQVVATQIKQARDLREFSDHLQSTVYGTYQDVLGLATRPEGVKDAQQALDEEMKTMSIAAKEGIDPGKQLQVAADAVTTAAQALTRSLQSVNITGLNQQFAACLNPVKAIQVRRNLVISPSALVRLEPNKSARVLVTGGQPPYTATALWSADTNLTVEGPPASGPATVEIKAGDVKPATYHLMIQDSQGSEKMIRIEVRQPSGKKPPSEPSEDAKLSAQVKVIQDRLNAGDLKAQNWTNAARTPWEGKAEGEKIVLTLKFQTGDAARIASTDDKVRRLKTVNGQGRNEISVAQGTEDQTLLVVTIEKGIAIAVVDAITANTWP